MYITECRCIAHLTVLQMVADEAGGSEKSEQKGNIAD